MLHDVFNVSLRPISGVTLWFVYIPAFCRVWAGFVEPSASLARWLEVPFKVQSGVLGGQIKSLTSIAVTFRGLFGFSCTSS